MNVLVDELIWSDRLTTAVYVRLKTQEKATPAYAAIFLCFEA
jgi:hypothetical protein